MKKHKYFKKTIITLQNEKLKVTYQKKLKKIIKTLINIRKNNCLFNLSECFTELSHYGKFEYQEKDDENVRRLRKIKTRTIKISRRIL